MRVRTLGAAAALLAILAAGACGSGATLAPSGQAATGAPRPVGVQDPAVIPTASPAAPGSCNARASLRPSGVLPAAGKMPAGSTMDKIVRNGRLVVGVSQNGYLFGYRDSSSGQLVGFEIDIARELARALFGDPTKIQFRAISAADRIPMIQSGEIDMVVRSMTMTCDRWRDVSFSSEYFTSGQRILVPASSTVQSLADLGGKKVCAAQGSTAIPVLAAAGSHPVPVATVDAIDCLVMMEQGQVDAISTDDTILAGLHAQDPDTRLVGPRLTDEPYGVAISKNSPDLVRFVNQVLDKMRADGTWARIYNDNLSALGAPPTPPAPQYQG
jgi:polar amino acid transport system substrate-binding protein